MVIGFIIMLAIFITKTNYAQNTEIKDKGKKKTVILKIMADNNGKTTIIDTTFTMPEGSDLKEIQEMTDKLGKEMKGIEDEMKEMQFNILVDMSDSTQMDSLGNVVEKVVVLNKGHRNHFKMHCGEPNAFDYEFEVPSHRDIIRKFNDFDRQGLARNWGDHDERVYRFDNNGGSLTDILGNIPMERVRNYSIKDTKYGKKIVIEIED